MKHLSIVVPTAQINLSTIACVAGVYEIFTRANEYYKKNGLKEVLYGQ